MGVLPSDERLNNIVNLELYWIAAMINKDEEESFLRRRDELEYLASFTNPEAINKIIEMRKNAIAVPDDDFAQMLQNLSGRDLPEFAPVK